jgi:hypothetical protein
MFARRIHARNVSCFKGLDIFDNTLVTNFKFTFCTGYDLVRIDLFTTNGTIFLDYRHFLNLLMMM